MGPWANMGGAAEGNTVQTEPIAHRAGLRSLHRKVQQWTPQDWEGSEDTATGAGVRG